MQTRSHHRERRSADSRGTPAADRLDLPAGSRAAPLRRLEAPNPRGARRREAELHQEEEAHRGAPSHLEGHRRGVDPSRREVAQVRVRGGRGAREPPTRTASDPDREQRGNQNPSEYPTDGETATPTLGKSACTRSSASTPWLFPRGIIAPPAAPAK